MSFSSKSVLVSLLLAASALAACSSSTSPTIPAGPAAGADISIFPDKVFVGVDETGKALGSAPIGLTGATGTVTWTSSSASVATATGKDKSGSISGVKPGTATVTIKAGTKTATVAVTVLTYPAADAAKGQAEYAAAKCADCHGADGPDITPSGLGKHDDAEIMGAVTESTNPEGGPITPAHKYTATAAIIAYLRSLPARTDTPVKDE